MKEYRGYQRKMTLEELQTLQRVAGSTWNAYSRYAFRANAWEDCAVELMGRGLSPEAAIQYLRSKHMRWLRDLSPRRGGTYTVADLRAYIAKAPDSLTEAIGKGAR